MSKFLVVPKCLVTGNTAPGIVVDGQEAKDASESAQNASRLGDFKTWDFTRSVKKLREKQSIINLRQRQSNNEQ